MKATPGRGSVLVAKARRLHLLTAEARASLHALADSRDRLPIVCVCCARARLGSGEWVLLLPGVEDARYLRKRPLLTHAVCPDCERRAPVADSALGSSSPGSREPQTEVHAFRST